MTEKELRKTAEMVAPKAAEALCTKNCLCGFDCGRTHGMCGSWNITIPLSGELTECPISKYGQEAKDGLWEDPDNPVDEDMILYLCVNCEHSVLVKQGSGYAVNRPNFTKTCIDCPVQSFLEAIAEGWVEAESL